MEAQLIGGRLAVIYYSATGPVPALANPVASEPVRAVARYRGRLVDRVGGYLAGSTRRLEIPAAAM